MFRLCGPRSCRCWYQHSRRLLSDRSASSPGRLDALDARRRIAKDIDLLDALQKLEGNDRSKDIMATHLRDSIIDFKAGAETFRELRALMFGSLRRATKNSARALTVALYS
jgi:hypothetical protein